MSSRNDPPKTIPHSLPHKEDLLTYFDHTAEGVILIGADGSIEFSNKAAASMLGSTPAERFAEHTARFPDQAHVEMIGTVREGSHETEPERYEMEIQQQDGATRRLLVYSIPRFVSGQFAGSLKMLTDITKLRLIEQVEEAERRQREIVEALSETSSALNSSLDLEEVLGTILLNATRIAPHDAANIMMVRDGDAWVVRSSGYNEAEPWVNSQRFVVAETYRMSQMAATMSPAIVSNTYECADWVIFEPVSWIRSSIGVPINLDGECLGFLHLDSHQEGTFTESHGVLLKAFADQAAVAIRNARLYAAERRERALAQTFQRAAEALAEAMSLSDVLKVISSNLNQIVHYERAQLLLVEDDHLRLAAVHGYSENSEPPSAEVRYPDMSMLYRSMRLAEPLINPHVRYGQELSAGLPAMTNDTGSWLGVPIVAAHVVIGYLIVASSRWHAYGPVDVDAVLAFTDQLVQAIENFQILSELKASRTTLNETRSHLSRVARLSTAGEIAAGMAHQINNPLAAILAHAYLLLKKLPENDPIRASIVSIDEAARRAGHVVQRILDFGRTTPSIMSPVNLNASIEAAVALVRAQIEPHTATIVLDLASNLPHIVGSGEYLEDVWINLLLNARDALANHENGFIRISTRLTLEQDGVEICIEDNGPGFRPEDRDKAWEPFFTTKAHGTGLGLSICRDVIRTHRGTIHIEAADGGGASIRVFLPVSLQGQEQ